MILTIVIPTLGRPTLKRSIDSVIKLNTVLEILIVGNSIENLPKYLKSRKIKYLRSQEIDACSKRNKGLEQANGELILFLDDDDFLMLTDYQVTKIYEILSNNNYAGAVMNTRVINPESERIIEKGLGSVGLSDLLFKNKIGTTSSVVLKTSLLKYHDIQFDHRNKCRQDYDFWLRTITETQSHFYLSGFLGLAYDNTQKNYRLSSQSMFTRMRSITYMYFRHVKLRPILFFTIFNHLRYLGRDFIKRK